MKIIILGAGQVGATLAENLSLDNEVTVVDINSGRLLALQNRLDIRTIKGVSSYPKVLEDAGADDADMIIAVTSSDDANIVACQVAYCLFKTPTKIARVRHRALTEYPDLFKPGNIDIDMIINPPELVTKRIERQIEHPGTITILNFADNQIQIAAIRATPPASVIGFKVQELDLDIKENHASIVGIIRDRALFFPDKDTVIRPYDEIYYCASTDNIKVVTEKLLGDEYKYRRITIAGGGNIGIRLAQCLEKKYKVRLIEHGEKQAAMAAQKLSSTIVLRGDASDSDLLIAENIAETDLFCSVTNDDEDNIMSAIIAKRLGAKHTFALVNRQMYAHYLIERSPDIDFAISPQRITGGCILTYLRKGDMVNVYPLPMDLAEAIEIVIHGSKESSKVIGRAVKEIKLPPECYICAIFHDGEANILVDGDTILEEGDHVILLVRDKSVITGIEKLFQVTPTFF